FSFATNSPPPYFLTLPLHDALPIYAIAGLHPPRSGRLLFAGSDVTRLAGHRYCDAGIAIVPEGRRLFTGMSVADNLEVGAHVPRSEEHTSELQSRENLVCRLLLEKK